MDESERRRKRLQAMRNEAAEREASSTNQVQVSGFLPGLANPLTDASSLRESPRSAPRFDYYTDPVASFSANRRGNVGSHGQRGFVPSPGRGRAHPVRQMPPHPEPWNPRMSMHPFPGPAAYQARGSFTGALPYGAPIGSENPYHEMPPGVGNPPGYAVNYHPQSNLPRGANFHSYGGQSGRHDFGQGRGRPFQGSYSGRGRGNWADNKVRMGHDQSGNRNQGSTNSMQKSLYEKFMVDDPWKSLKPSLWREEAPAPEISLPASRTVWAKRPLEISTPAISNSQSLAEYLAESFNEAVNGDPDV